VAILVVLSVVSVRVTPRVAKKGGMLFVVIDCLLFVVVVFFVITHQHSLKTLIFYTCRANKQYFALVP
jgi:hypothetical protein